MIDIERIEESESYWKERSPAGGIIFAILAVITLGVVALALGSGLSVSAKSEKGTRFISYLAIQLIDNPAKSVRRILISGSKRRIERFIDRYQNRLIKLS